MKQTSIRVDETQLHDFGEKCKAIGKSANETINDFIQEFLAGRRGTTPSHLPEEVDKLTDLLANIVADYLRTDKAWARRIVRSAPLRWPGGILESRMAHYATEKFFLAKKFSEWLTQRIAHLLQTGNVYLFIDAGSTNLWFCLSFWSQLSRLSATRRQGQIILVTNNFPVAESFAEEDKKHHFGEGTAITCDLLGGQMDKRYAALVGRLTRRNLKEYRGEDKIGKEHYITLAAGNFLRLNRDSGVVYPIPLVRPKPQKEIKNLYVAAGDEVYVIAPLGKIFKGSTNDLNIEYKKLAKNQEVGDYDEVDVLVENRSRVKLVTTLRKSMRSILYDYSENVISPTLAGGEPEPNSTTAELNAIHHFCYVLDTHVEGLPRRKQLEIEFPHVWMHDINYLKNYYSVI